MGTGYEGEWKGKGIETDRRLENKLGMAFESRRGLGGNTNILPSVAIPCIIVASVNAKIRWDAHWEHVAHEEHENPRAERPEYSYQNIRTKNYFWGDGDKVRHPLRIYSIRWIY
jgi:hypothetical protein